LFIAGASRAPEIKYTPLHNSFTGVFKNSGPARIGKASIVLTNRSHTLPPYGCGGEARAEASCLSAEHRTSLRLNTLLCTMSLEECSKIQAPRTSERLPSSPRSAVTPSPPPYGGVRERVCTETCCLSSEHCADLKLNTLLLTTVLRVCSKIQVPRASGRLSSFVAFPPIPLIQSTRGRGASSEGSCLSPEHRTDLRLNTLLRIIIL
jgi:hypothetical protein